MAVFAWTDGGKTKEPGKWVNKNLGPTDIETDNHYDTIYL
jgi:hypothetical protein